MRRILLHIQLPHFSLPDEIIFVRHGESIGNAKKKDDNSTDSIPNHQFNLTPLGQQQAREAGHFLNQYFSERNPPAEYYISTFLRTQETFKFLNLKGNPTPFEDPHLDEYWRGIFHSLSESDIAMFYPIEYQIAEREGWYHYRPPQGESGKDVELRTLHYVSSLRPHARILICGHGQWFCFLERILCGKSRAEMRTVSPKNCSVISFKKEGSIFSSNILFEPDKNAP